MNPYRPIRKQINHHWGRKRAVDSIYSSVLRDSANLFRFIFHKECTMVCNCDFVIQSDQAYGGCGGICSGGGTIVTLNKA